MTQEQKDRLIARIKAVQAQVKALANEGRFRKTYVPVIKSALNTALKDAAKGDEQ